VSLRSIRGGSSCTAKKAIPICACHCGLGGVVGERYWRRRQRARDQPSFGVPVRHAALSDSPAQWSAPRPDPLMKGAPQGQLRCATRGGPGLRKGSNATRAIAKRLRLRARQVAAIKPPSPPAVLRAAAAKSLERTDVSGGA
jgi:hypothetical protein